MESLDVHISVLVVAFLMGAALAWINLGDQVKNFAAGVGLTLVVAVAGAALLLFFIPGTDVTTDEPLPTGGRVDWMLGQWADAIVGVVVRQSPIAFWVGLVAGIGAFLYWKSQRGTTA